MIVNAVERHALRTAFVCRGGEISYARVGHEISKTIQLFQELGLNSGDAVMQLTANRHEMFVVMAAAYIGGYVSVVPNYSSSLEDHQHMLDDSGAVLLIVDAARADRAIQLKSGARKPVQVWSHDPVDGLNRLWDAAANFVPQALRACDKPDENVRLIYTGGTTGRPKGVMTLSRALAFASLLHISEQNLDVHTKLLVSSPLSHGAGALVIPVLVKGGQIVIHEKFDTEGTIDAIETGLASTLFLVPTMLYALLDNPRIAGVHIMAPNNDAASAGCDPVPTGLAYGPGNSLYVSMLSAEAPGEGRVYVLDATTGAVTMPPAPPPPPAAVAERQLSTTRHPEPAFRQAAHFQTCQIGPIAAKPFYTCCLQAELNWPLSTLAPRRRKSR